MKALRLLSATLIILSLFAAVSSAEIPYKWEELTAPDFALAVEKSGGTCIIPIGVIEKHGPHLPLGTDVLNVRSTVFEAVKQEYAIVFPSYYFGQIHEARHQPGTVAYSPELLWKMLQETCDELGRNGIKNIILVNGHGGNRNFLPYFCQSLLEKQRDYAVMIFQPELSSETAAKIKSMKKTTVDGHAGEGETSEMMLFHPDITHLDRAKDQSGADLDRLDIPHAYTAIWWYAKFPNHYAGDGSYGNTDLAHVQLESKIEQLAELIKAVKKDNTVHRMQEQFYKESAAPLNTRQ